MLSQRLEARRMFASSTCHSLSRDVGTMTVAHRATLTRQQRTQGLKEFQKPRHRWQSLLVVSSCYCSAHYLAIICPSFCLVMLPPDPLAELRHTRKTFPLGQQPQCWTSNKPRSGMTLPWTNCNWHWGFPTSWLVMIGFVMFCGMACTASRDIMISQKWLQCPDVLRLFLLPLLRRTS